MMSEEKNESFEEKMTKLDDIVRELDNDDVSLEKSLELYKKGVELSHECEKILKDAELKVETLNKDSNDE